MTGGYVYRGAAIPACCAARTCSPTIAWASSLRSCNATVPSPTRRSSAPQTSEVTSFGEDAAGELYVLSRSGSIFRIDPA